MKTAIQQAIELLTKQFNATPSTQEKVAYANSIMVLQSLLPTEREVIEEAYHIGREDGGRGTINFNYFTTKFNDNEQ